MMANPNYITDAPLDCETMRLYIPREADGQALEKLKAGECVVIYEPPGQGKTSLLLHLRELVALHQSDFIFLDMAAADLDASTEEGWYRDLAKAIRLQGEEKAFDRLPAPRNGKEWSEYLSGVAKIAAGRNRRLIFLCDNVGQKPFPHIELFYNGIRWIYSQRHICSENAFLTFVLAGMYNPYRLTQDRRISQFNVSHRISLRNFHPEQVRQLVGLGSWGAEQADRLAERIYYWTSGHPYLTQWVCQRLETTSQEADVDRAVHQLIHAENPHLSIIRNTLSKNRHLCDYANKIYRADQRLEKEIVYIPEENYKQVDLELLGLLRDNAQGYVYIPSRVQRIMLELALGGAEPVEAPVAAPPEREEMPFAPASPGEQPASPASWPQRVQITFTPESRVFPTTTSHYLRSDQFSFMTLKIDGADLPEKETILRISARIEGRSFETLRSVCLRRDEQIEEPIPLVLDPKETRALNSIQPGNVIIHIEQINEDKRLDWAYDLSAPIYLQARDVALLGIVREDGAILDLSDNLAAWVTYADPEINHWVHEAADLLPPGQHMTGYQGGGSDENRARIVREQVKAIYRALNEKARIKYINSIFSLGSENGEISQRIRLPVQSLRDRGANCIDAAVLFASLLEAASLQPVILILDGHALVGWKTWQNSDSFEFLETTMLSESDFEEANAAGQKTYAQLVRSGAFSIPAFQRGFARLIDVARVQKLQKIYPFASMF